MVVWLSSLPFDWFVLLLVQVDTLWDGVGAGAEAASGDIDDSDTDPEPDREPIVLMIRHTSNPPRGPGSKGP